MALTCSAFSCHSQENFIKAYHAPSVILALEVCGTVACVVLVHTVTPRNAKQSLSVDSEKISGSHSLLVLLINMSFTRRGFK